MSGGVRVVALGTTGAAGRVAIVVGWLATRLLMIAILVSFERFVVGDVFYYHRKIAGLFDVGLAGTLNEYPTPVVWILWLPYGVTGGSATGYLVAFMVFMVLLDAAFTYALYRTGRRTGGRRHDVAIDFWLLFVFLHRPAVLPAVRHAARRAGRRRPAGRPPTTLGHRRPHRPRRGGQALAGAADRGLLRAPSRTARRPAGASSPSASASPGLSLLTGGWTRLVSPLTWQSGRGLQVESIWATPLMLARAFSPRLAGRHLPLPGVRDLRARRLGSGC